MNYTIKTVVLWYRVNGVIKAEVFANELMAAEVAASMQYTSEINIIGIQRHGGGLTLSMYWQPYIDAKARLEEDMKALEQNAPPMRQVLFPFATDVEVVVDIREDLPHWTGR